MDGGVVSQIFALRLEGAKPLHLRETAGVQLKSFLSGCTRVYSGELVLIKQKMLILPATTEIE